MCCIVMCIVIGCLHYILPDLPLAPSLNILITGLLGWTWQLVGETSRVGLFCHLLLEGFPGQPELPLVRTERQWGVKQFQAWNYPYRYLPTTI